MFPLPPPLSLCLSFLQSPSPWCPVVDVLTLYRMGLGSKTSSKGSMGPGGAEENERLHCVITEKDAAITALQVQYCCIMQRYMSIVRLWHASSPSCHSSIILYRIILKSYDTWCEVGRIMSCFKVHTIMYHTIWYHIMRKVHVIWYHTIMLNTTCKILLHPHIMSYHAIIVWYKKWS